MTQPPPKDPAWEHFEEAFRHFDRGWESADRFFETVRHEKFTDPADPRGRQTHRLKAKTAGARIRLAWLFLKLSLKMLFRGRVTVRL